ncbi:MAG: FecR family protein [Rhodospirillum sp.]|nr:FecR family protein [Rhodospirillum sp.]MCF8490249.1 FecR family protein [Rhodospirillum sp.]MCF8501254.1 FecR family protein [Rhodospirillum sp.]
MTCKRVEREATEWLLLSREFPDDPDLWARFRSWLEADASHAAAWRDVTHVDALIGTVFSEGTTQGAPFLKGKEEKGRGEGQGASAGGALPSRRLVWRATASLLVALLVVGFVSLRMPGLILKVRADYVTGTGERRDLRLDDGSMVFLAPESAISVAFHGRERRVRLLAGRAFFEVAPDPDRPFEVRAEGVTTRVLGTAFDESVSGSGANIAVRHGLVRVDYAGGGRAVSESLTAGDWLRVGKDGFVDKGAGQPDQVGSWRTGELVVQDRSITEVVDALRPYYNGAIVFANGEVGDLRVTGVYDLNNPMQALRALAQAHEGLGVHSLSSWLVVLSKS